MKKHLPGYIFLSLALALPGIVFAQNEENAEEEEFENDDVAAAYTDENGNTVFRSAEQVQEEEFNRDTHEEDARRREESEARLENWTTPITFGLRANAGLNWLSGGDASVWGWETGFSFGVGGFMSINISKMFQLAPEVAVAYRRNTFSHSSSGALAASPKTTGHVSAWELDVPLLLRINLPEGSEIVENIFVEAGPQLGINISSDDGYEFGDDSGSDITTPAALEAGITIGIGYRINREMAADIRFYRAFTDYLKSSDICVSERQFSTMQFNIGFIYSF